MYSILRSEYGSKPSVRDIDFGNLLESGPSGWWVKSRARRRMSTMTIVDRGDFRRRDSESSVP